MEFEFSNSTLNNVQKKAKKLRKESSLNLAQAKDKIAKDLGFKSYSDLAKQFYEWLNKEPVYLVLRQSDLAHHTYQKEKEDETIPYRENEEHRKEQQRRIKDPEEFNHTRKCGLRLLTGEENEKMQKKFSSHIFKHIPGHIYQLTSYRVEKMDYGYRLPYSVAYDIHNYLSDRVKVYGDYHYESVDFFDGIYYVGNSFYYAFDLFDEDCSDHVMPADFYN